MLNNQPLTTCFAWCWNYIINGGHCQIKHYKHILNFYKSTVSYCILVVKGIRKGHFDIMIILSYRQLRALFSPFLPKIRAWYSIGKGFSLSSIRKSRTIQNRGLLPLKTSLIYLYKQALLNNSYHSLVSP